MNALPVGGTAHGESALPPPPGPFEIERPPARDVSATLDEKRLEALARQHGRALFGAIALGERAARWRPRALAERSMLGLLLSDPALKYRLLRFVDAFPALQSPQAVADVLAEYLTHDLSMPGGANPGRLEKVARKLAPELRRWPWAVAQAARFAIGQMAQQFIAGETPQHVAPRLAKLEAEGFLFSIDLLGEFVASEAQADDYASRYLAMLGSLPGALPPPATAAPRHAGPRLNLSIKLSALTSKFEPMDPEGTAETVLERLRPILREARRQGAFVNIDMEKYEWRDTTLALLRQVLSEAEFSGWTDLGIVAQAYLRDAEDALRELLEWLAARGQQLTIRLVKGAYWDSEQVWAAQRGWPVPVLMDKRRTDAQYERMLRLLLENHATVRTAAASHNVRSLAHALALRDALRAPHDRFEFQVLYGMAGPIAAALRDTGAPTRVYAPCGALIPGMGYLVRRLLENTANDSFLRQRFLDRVLEEQLLADPKEMR